MSSTTAVAEHYRSPGLLDRIEGGLSMLGKSTETVALDDLAPVDEYHLRGAAATLELIEWLDPEPEAHVLDAGSGLGGPARRLAQMRGCKVTGVDLSEEFCTAGSVINDWASLGGLVNLVPGDVTKLDGFADASFDAAWTIHVGMNIADKTSFYREIARVLKPGSRFALYDVLAADGQPEVEYPMPWARDSSASFLTSLDRTTNHLEEVGFSIENTQDQTAQGLAFLDESIARASKLDGPSPLVLHLILGPDFAKIVPNMRKNFTEGRIRLVAIQCRKPAQ
jgi:ubiquinone/menaquinone biosynthesis C-methylase UbiE